MSIVLFLSKSLVALSFPFFFCVYRTYQNINIVGLHYEELISELLYSLNQDADKTRFERSK